MRYDYETFMDKLYQLMDMAEDGGGSIFEDYEQESSVIGKLREIKNIML